jgi:hypothetical protein
MREWLIVLALVACDSKKKPEGGATGSGSAGSGSGSASATGSATGSGSAAGSAAACDLTGNYRLRFFSNGAEGWWLRLAVAGKDVKPAGATNMLGLDEKGRLDAQFDDKACRLTLTKKTDQAGDLKIVLDVAGDKVTGTVSRTKNASEGKDTSPITGLRETAPPKYPPCIKPGVYTLNVENVKKWKTDGDPRFGASCKSNAGTVEPFIRVELLGDTLLIDEASSGDAHEQSFGRATVKREGECDATIAIEVQDFKLATAKITFAGDKITGKTTDFTYEVFEDGEAGENQWSCTTKQGDVVGKRVGD